MLATDYGACDAPGLPTGCVGGRSPEDCSTCRGTESRASTPRSTRGDAALRRSPARDRGRAARWSLSRRAFLLKDLDADCAGTPMASGQPLHGRGAIGSRRDPGGALPPGRPGVAGKTNTPELGLTPTTEPELFGPRATPGTRAARPGVSSGARRRRSRPACPGSSLQRRGGSIGFPASCCGLFGLQAHARAHPGRPRLSGLGGMAIGHVNHAQRSRQRRLARRDRGTEAGAAHQLPGPRAPLPERSARRRGDCASRHPAHASGRDRAARRLRGRRRGCRAAGPRAGSRGGEQ